MEMSMENYVKNMHAYNKVRNTSTCSLREIRILYIHLCMIIMQMNIRQKLPKSTLLTSNNMFSVRINDIHSLSGNQCIHSLNVKR